MFSEGLRGIGLRYHRFLFLFLLSVFLFLFRSRFISHPAVRSLCIRLPSTSTQLLPIWLSEFRRNKRALSGSNFKKISRVEPCGFVLTPIFVSGGSRAWCVTRDESFVMTFGVNYQFFSALSLPSQPQFVLPCISFVLHDLARVVLASRPR